MSSLRIATLLALCCLPALAQGPQVVIGDRYRLQHEGTRAEAEEALAVLEKAWAGFKRYFRRAPKLGRGERLKVNVYLTQASWEAGMRADKVAPPSGAGGYYWPGTRTAYLYKQPTRYYTRALLLHEAAHQFHYLACTRNINPGASWYTEGVAEYLAWHTWDGETLTLAELPMSLKDYPAKALGDLKAGRVTLAKLLDGQGHRPLGCVLVRFLSTHRKLGARWRKLAALLDARRPSRKSFEKLFGKAEVVEKHLLAWLEQEQEPWAQIWNTWERIGPARFEGRSEGVYSISRHKRAARKITAQLEVPASGRWAGGLLLHFESGERYTMLIVRSDGRVEVLGKPRGTWQVLKQTKLAAPPGERLALEAERAGGEVIARVAGVEIGRWALPGGTFGLAVHDARLRFAEVAVTAAGAPAGKKKR